MKVGIIQHKSEAGSAQNKQILADKIFALAQSGAELVVLQELHDHLYFCQTASAHHFDLAETIPGEATNFYAEVAKKNMVVLVTSLFEKRAAGIYHNTAVVFENDGSIAGKYRKMHIPDDPGYHEKFYFTPGDGGFKPIETSLGKLGVMVCWDQWYPEAARIMALNGADLLIYPTAIGWDEEDSEQEQQKQLEAWIAVQKAHAIANGLPVVTVNRAGSEVQKMTGTQTSGGQEINEQGIRIWGHSFVLGPLGEVICMHEHDQEAQSVHEIDLTENEKTRRIWPFFRDRRIDEYETLLKRFDD